MFVDGEMCRHSLDRLAGEREYLAPAPVAEFSYPYTAQHSASLLKSTVPAISQVPHQRVEL